jgi:hypothetical protein
MNKALQICRQSLAFVLLSFASIASADVNYSYTLDGESAGFIGRGDVISHPDLGKAALVDSPTVSLRAEQSYAITATIEVAVETNGEPSTRILVDIVGEYRVTQTYNVNTKVIVVTRKAKGNDNINGYLVGDAEPSSTVDQQPPKVGDVIRTTANKITVLSATQQSDGKPYEGELNSIFNAIQFVTVASVELLAGGQESLVFDAGNGLVGVWLLDEFGDGYLNLN